MQNHHLDYYELGITPVMIVRDAQSGLGLQAWRADIETHKMVRDDTIILDIDDCGTHDFSALDHATFHAYCAELSVSVPPISFFNTPAANAVENMSPSFRRAVGQDFDDRDAEIIPNPYGHLRLVM